MDSSPTILIVDDHPSFRRCARVLLEEDGFAVVGEAEDGADALQAIDQLHPDVVLLDVQLPDMDGFAVLERLGAGEAAGRPRLEPGGVRLQRPHPFERRTRLHRQGRADGRRCSLPPAVTRGRLAAAVVVGTALYAVAIYLVVTADLGEPRALITMVTVAGLIFSVAGTIAALQRPDNRTGAQMLAVGLLWSVGALQLADRPIVFTIGYLLCGRRVRRVRAPDPLVSEREAPSGDEWIVWAVLAIVTLGPLAISLFDASPIPGCDDCPESAFLVTDSTALARAAGFALALSAAAVATVVFIRLVRRYRAASPPLRRVIGPVYFFTLIALVGLVTSNLAWTFDENAGLAIEIAALASLALMPVAFLAGVLRTRLQRAGIADLVIALGNGQPLRDALADALGDPSLGLAYWSSQRQAWVDEDGRTMTEPIARGAHAATFVENDGKRVAALLHDRSLADQRPLVDAVAATAGLAFEKERLQAELRAQYRFLETIIDTAPSLLVGGRHRGPDPELQPRGRDRERAPGSRRSSRGGSSGRSSSTRPSARR